MTQQFPPPPGQQPPGDRPPYGQQPDGQQSHGQLANQQQQPNQQPWQSPQPANPQQPWQAPPGQQSWQAPQEQQSWQAPQEQQSWQATSGQQPWQAAPGQQSWQATPGQQPPPYGQQPWQTPQEQQPGPVQGFPPPPKSKAPLIIGLVVALVVVGGLIVWLVQPSHDSPPPSANPGGPSVTGTPSWRTSATTTSPTPTTEETTVTTDTTDADLADVGDCIKVNSASATDADVERIDCSSPDAVYKVGKVIYGTTGECPSDSYSKYTHSGGYTLDIALCLMLNAKKGDCFANVTSSSGATDKVSCSAPDAEGKVTKVVNGKASESACPSATGLALVYPEPGETICLVKVN